MFANMKFLIFFSFIVGYCIAENPFSLDYRCVNGTKSTCPARRSSSSFVCKYSEIKSRCHVKYNSTSVAIQAALTAKKKKCKKCQGSPGAKRQCSKNSCILKASGFSCALDLEEYNRKQRAAARRYCADDLLVSRKCNSYYCAEKQTEKAERAETCPNAISAFDEMCKIYNRSKCNRRRSATCCKTRKCAAIKDPTCKACETSKREACLRQKAASSSTSTVLTVSSCPGCKKKSCQIKSCIASGACKSSSS